MDFNFIFEGIWGQGELFFFLKSGHNQVTPRNWTQTWSTENNSFLMRTSLLLWKLTFSQKTHLNFSRLQELILEPGLASAHSHKQLEASSLFLNKCSWLMLAAHETREAFRAYALLSHGLILLQLKLPAGKGPSRITTHGPRELNEMILFQLFRKGKQLLIL